MVHEYNLGKVLLTPKGAYSNNETYERLDFVLYKNATFVAKTETKGNLPTNSEYWQLLVPEKCGEENVIEQIEVNGTPVQPDEDKTVNIEVPTELRELESDETHRLVTDDEKGEWNDKLDPIKNPTSGNFVSIKEDGTLEDSNFDSSSFAPPMVMLTYGKSTWADFLAAFATNSLVYCKVDGRLAFMAYIAISGSTMTNVEFQYYRSVNTHSDSVQGDEVYVYKLESNNTWTTTKRNTYTRIKAGNGLASTFGSGSLTLSLNVIVEKSEEGGVKESLVTNGEKYVWYNKQNKITVIDVSQSLEPITAMKPNVIYDFGVIDGITFEFPAFGKPESGDTEAKIWCWTFNTGVKEPTIKWPSDILGWAGGEAPVIDISKYYEVTVMNGIGTILST